MSDRKAKRLLFIRVGFILCAITFGLHYFADNTTYLIIARLGAGIASGIMIPPMLAYAYEAGKGKSKVASVISFHALGWLAGIVAAGLANDEKLIFIVSSCFFIIGFIISLRLPKIQTEKIVEKGIIKKIIVKNKFLFSSLLIRHIGAAAAWTVLPIMLMEYFGTLLASSAFFSFNSTVVFRITHAGTADACFVFLINLIFLADVFLAPMKFQTDFPLFKSSVILLYKTKYSASG